jgi:hypothetical protein
LAPFGEFFKSIIPLILGLLAGLFYRNSLDKKHATLSASLFYLSPLFLTTFTTLSNEMLAAFLVIMNFFVLKKRRIILFTIIQAIVALTHFEIWLFSSIYFVYTNRNYAALIPGLLLSFFTFSYDLGFQRIFSELGAAQGYSLFIFLLAIIGFVWKRKSPLLTIMFFLGLISTIFFSETRILGVLILIPYASKTIIKLIEREWELSHIKQATLFLILLVLIFSSLDKASELTNAEPNNLLIYDHLNQLPQGLVLADSEEGHYIQYFANKKTVVDKRSSQEEKEAMTKLLNSQNSVFVHEELKKLGTKYILVAAAEERKGFLFVADNSPNLTFLDSYDKELWLFTG